MAIAVDGTAYLSNEGTATLTYALTVGTANNRILFVGVTWPDQTRTVGTVTYNGVTMTSLVKRNTSGTNGVNQLFGLVAPGTGAHNVVVSISTSGEVNSGAVSFTGAAQTITPDAVGSFISSGTVVLGTVTTITNNDFLVDLTGISGNPQAANSSQTVVKLDTTTSLISYAMSYKGPVTPAGTVSDGWTYQATPADNGPLLVVAFAPFVAASTAPGPGFKTLLGAGRF